MRHSADSAHLADRAADVGVRQDDGGLALEGVEIPALKSFAGFGGGQELLDLVYEGRGIGVGGGRIRLCRLVHPHDQFGQRVEPCKPGIADHELEQGGVVLSAMEIR